jgi:hypothetical protein
VKVLKLILKLNIDIVMCVNDSEYKIVVIITIVVAVVIVT